MRREDDCDVFSLLSWVCRKRSLDVARNSRHKFRMCRPTINDAPIDMKVGLLQFLFTSEQFIDGASSRSTRVLWILGEGDRSAPFTESIREELGVYILGQGISISKGNIWQMWC